ncbi:MAG: hypothetical protein JJE04_04400 [Acidobacteriia bacterium]|nr:hypothetical protein [Terriglobia bacterium]
MILSKTDPIPDLRSLPLHRRLALGSLNQVIGLGIQFAGQLLLVPLFLMHMGSPLYGDWLALFAISTSIAFLDIGFQSHYITLLNRLWSQNRFDEFLAAFHSVTVAFAVLSGLVSLAISSSPFWIHWPTILKLSGQTNWEAAWVITLCTAATLANGYAAIVGGLYACLDLHHRHTSIMNLCKLLTLLLTATAILVFSTPFSAALAFFAGSIAALLIPLLGIRRSPMCAWLGIRHASFSHLASQSRDLLFFFLPPLATVMLTSGTATITTIALGAALLPAFVVPRTIYLFSRVVLQAMNTPLWIEVSKLTPNSSEDIKLRFKLLRKYAYCAAHLSACAAAILAVHSGAILRVWTGDRIHVSPSATAGFAIFMWSTGLWFTPQVFLLAANRHQTAGFLHLLSGLATLASALFLVPRYGIDGAAWSLVVGNCFLAGAILPLTCNRNGVQSPRLAVSVISSSAVLFILSFILLDSFSLLFHSVSVIALFSQLALSALLCVPCFLLFLPQDIRADFWRLLITLIPPPLKHGANSAESSINYGNR